MILPTATIASESPRRAAWLAVFGGDQIPIQSPFPVPAKGPDIDVVREFYKLDLTRVTPEQKQRLVRYLAERWKLPVDEVARGIEGEEGVPILAEDVSVIVDMRLFV